MLEAKIRIWWLGSEINTNTLESLYVSLKKNIGWRGRNYVMGV